jgi:hypothetical protein
MSRRQLHWGNALAAVKADRAARPEVRSESLKGTRDRNLLAWRGRSGRRYVFRSLPAADVDAGALRDAVVLGVDASGQIISAFAHCSMSAVMAMIDCGCVRVDIHTLCDSAAERADVARDLRPLAGEVAA